MDRLDRSLNENERAREKNIWLCLPEGNEEGNEKIEALMVEMTLLR